MRTLLVALICVAASTPGLAQTVPDYAVEKWCDEVARVAGDRSEVIYGSCIRQEQAAYDGIKGRWAALPTATRQWCDRVARTSGGGSYVILNSCVQQEQAASEQNQRQQFRR